MEGLRKASQARAGFFHSLPCPLAVTVADTSEHLTVVKNWVFHASYNIRRFIPFNYLWESDKAMECL